MNKTDAIALLGGSYSKAAVACGLTLSAVSQWPDVLKPHHVDRVQAALWRKQHGVEFKKVIKVTDRAPEERAESTTADAQG